MALIDHIEKFAGPFSTLVAAIVAATIAAKFAERQAQASEIQAKIARDKLKLDAINARIDVMEATQELIEYVTNLQHGEEADPNILEKFRQRTLKGRFLFRKDLYKNILETVHQCFEITGNSSKISGRLKSNRRLDTANLPRFDDFISRREMLLQRVRLPELLEKDIALELFDETSGKSAVSIDHKYVSYLKYLIFAIILFILFLASMAVSLSG